MKTPLQAFEEFYNYARQKMKREGQWLALELAKKAFNSGRKYEHTKQIARIQELEAQVKNYKEFFKK